MLLIDNMVESLFQFVMNFSQMPIDTCGLFHDMCSVITLQHRVQTFDLELREVVTFSLDPLIELLSLVLIDLMSHSLREMLEDEFGVSLRPLSSQFFVIFV